MWCEYNRLTILILDEDLRFAFWLSRLLDSAGYRAWPARSGADAAVLLGELGGRLDLLVINPHSRGAEDFVEGLRLQRSIKAVAVKMHNEEPSVLPEVDASLVKPKPIDRLSALEWVDTIDRVLAR